MADVDGTGRAARVLVAYGPTHEAIDAVRYIGNRSSGRLGAAIADACRARGWEVRSLVGPGGIDTGDTGGGVFRFRSAADLESLLAEHGAWADCVVMAAAVADYRPSRAESGKIRRVDGPLSIDLVPVPDLLAGLVSRVGSAATGGPFVVGFALEPREEMESSGRSKLERKGVDAIVANPLGTMESGEIEAVVLLRDGSTLLPPSAMGKGAFASWVMDALAGSIERASRRGER